MVFQATVSKTKHPSSQITNGNKSAPFKRRGFSLTNYLYMARSKQTFSKREKENKKLKQRIEKAEKKAMRKANNNKAKSLDEMLAYVDQNGNLSPVPDK